MKLPPFHPLQALGTYAQAVGATVAGIAMSASVLGGFAHPAEQSAGCAPAPGNGKGTFLVTGDSIAFGQDPNKDRKLGASQYTSYGDSLSKDYGANEINIATPGETSNSFMNVDAPNNGGWLHDPKTGKAIKDPVTGEYVHDFPLHYNFGIDQLDETIKQLKEHPDTRLLTVQLGGNDLLQLQQHAKASGWPVPLYELVYLPSTVINLYENLSTSLNKIREVYHGPIVVVNNYSLDYSNPVNGIALGAASLAQEWAARSANHPCEPAVMADVYKAFEKAVAQDPNAKGSTGKAGLLIPWKQGDNGYDVHPSDKGKELMGQTIEKAAAPYVQG